MASKRFVAFGFEVEGPIIMLAVDFKSFQIDVLASFSFNSGGTWSGQGALSSAVHPLLLLPSISQPIV